MKNNKGFTLVEILAVLVLISLMMVIIVPSIQKVALNSKIKLCNSKINLAEESINLWARDNYKCFNKTDGCNILSNCQENNDIIKCESTFKTLAENNLLNYDKNVKNINYVVNPINNGNMNDTKIYIEFNSKNKQVKSYIDDTIVDKVCSKNASEYNDPIVEEIETTTTRTTTTTTTTPTVNPTTFANDSWKTISKVVKSNRGESYPIGATKEVEIDGTNYTVRVANNTTPEECTREDFSQTACGFVVEFTEVVAKRNINPSKPGTQFQYGWNVDGWPASDMRNNYANSEFFNSLPDDLKNVIIETKAISGHGSTSGETNFISTDEKIYLLSPHEVYEDGTSNKVSTSDTAYSQTRQLDYYKSKGVTTTNYASAAKKYGTETSRWWLRSARKDTNVYFISVTENGTWGSNGASGNYGFSPAFRID